jgi:rare lipoprotein A
MFQLVALMLFSQQALEPVSQGVASYYTVDSCGRTTASGDPLKDTGYTCAMREGQFGGFYLVVAENGSSVVCRLNDRGPFIKGRVIDLSHAAMRQLHASAGLLKVKVYKIDLAMISGLLGIG